MATTNPNNPVMIKIICQLKVTNIQDNTGANNPNAKYSVAVYAPTAFARSLSGNHDATHLIFDGIMGASNMPNKILAPINVDSLDKKPINNVEKDHPIIAMVIKIRGPTLSSIIPARGKQNA